MDDQCETVKVCNPDDPGGYMIINKSDMTDAHKLFDFDAEQPAPQSAIGFHAKHRGRGKFGVARPDGSFVDDRSMTRPDAAFAAREMNEAQ